MTDRNEEGLSDAGVAAIFLLLALALNLLNMAAMDVVNPIRADAEQYFTSAYNLVYNGVYADRIDGESITISRLPGYPLILSAVMLVETEMESFYRGALFVNAILGAFTVALFYLVLRRFMPRIWAVAGGILLALNPHILSLQGYILTETLFLFELVAITYLTIKAIDSARVWIWLLVGFLLAYSTLTRPSFIPFVPLMLGFVFYALRAEGGVAWRSLAAVVLGLVLTLSPWFAYTKSKDLPFTGTKGEVHTLAAGFFPNFIYKDPRYYGVPYRDPAVPAMFGSYGDSLRQLGEWVREDPVKYISWFLVGKPVAFWSWNTVQGVGDVYIYEVSSTFESVNPVYRQIKNGYRFIYPILAGMMVLGLLLALVRRDNMIALLCSAIVVYFTALHIVFFALPRYSIPLRPMMIFLALYALHYGYGWVRERMNPQGKRGRVLGVRD